LFFSICWKEEKCSLTSSGELAGTRRSIPFFVITVEYIQRVIDHPRVDGERAKLAKSSQGGHAHFHVGAEIGQKEKTVDERLDVLPSPKCLSQHSHYENFMYIKKKKKNKGLGQTYSRNRLVWRQAD